MCFDATETQLLMVLFDELAVLLDSGDDDEVLSRLSPAAYPEDPDAEAEYRALTAESLHSQRSEGMAACRADLTGAEHIDLSDPEAGRRWLQALNVLRLALGTRLGVTQDEERPFDPTDPAGQSWMVYYWLTELQDALVRSLLD